MAGHDLPALADLLGEHAQGEIRVMHGGLWLSSGQARDLVLAIAGLECDLGVLQDSSYGE